MSSRLYIQDCMTITNNQMKTEDEEVGLGIVILAL